MEKLPSFVSMPSLEQMALRRVAIDLYREPRILTSIAKFRFKLKRDCQNIWDASNDLLLNSRSSSRRRPAPPTSDYKNVEWRRIVEDKMAKLQLPKSLARQMKPVLRAVGSELYTWKSIHEEYLSGSSEHLYTYVLQELCWTTLGTVDYRKTAKILISFDFLDIMKRFELACLYCLEEHVPILWVDMPYESKKYFYNEELSSGLDTPHLQLFLPRILRKLSTIYSAQVYNSFEISALWGNKTLAEYCFFKLTREDREASLVETAKAVLLCRLDFFNKNDFRRKKLSDVAIFLLSLMSPEEQIRILELLPCEVLSCFLDWPYQDLFMDMADVVWTFLPVWEYSHLVNCINKIIKYSGYYFPDFFQNLFLRSPAKFRETFVNEEIIHEYFLWDFFTCEDTETIKVFFRSIDAADRVRLVSSQGGLHLIYRWHFKWHLVEEFLRAATLSREEKDRLKEDFIPFASYWYRTCYCSVDWLKEEYRMFFEFVGETNADAENKRSLEDETWTNAKKLCYEKTENSTA